MHIVLMEIEKLDKGQMILKLWEMIHEYWKVGKTGEPIQDERDETLQEEKSTILRGRLTLGMKGEVLSLVVVIKCFVCRTELEHWKNCTRN